MTAPDTATPARQPRVSDEELHRWLLPAECGPAWMPSHRAALDLRDARADFATLKAENARLNGLVETLTSERDEARERVHYATGTADLAMRHRDFAEAERDALLAERAGVSEALQRACDFLAERTYGNAARSPSHNARLVLEAALAAQPAPDRRQDARAAIRAEVWEEAAKIADERGILNRQCAATPMFDADPLWHEQRAAEATTLAAALRAAAKTEAS